VRAIADEGLSAASIRVFARRAGVSVGALQHYFNSKDELILGCLAHVYDGYLQGTLRILAGTAPARQRLELLIRWMLGGDEELDQLWRVWLAFAPETIREPGVASVDFDATARWRSVVGVTVQEAIDDGELAGDAASVTTGIATVVNGALLGIHSRPPRLTREAAITLCLRLLQEKRAGA
jgi:AcrR family transcriptional regulator